MKNIILGMSGSVLAMAMAHPASAQVVDAQAEGVQSSNTGGIEDIVVTAQRREESAQRAAIPVDVLSSKALTRAGITRPDQLGQLAPSLTITASAGGRNNFFMRGVGNFTGTPAYDSAIALNYDGVYVSKPGGASGVFYDLQRVEVLIGPQGTLYGRNATGGAINVIPVHPIPGEFSGYVTGSVGNYDAYSLEGAVNVSLSQTAAIRLSGSRVKRDGHMSDGSSADDSRALRAQFLAELTPELTLRVGADYSGVRGLSSGTYYHGYYTPQNVFVPSGIDPSTGNLDPISQAYRQSLFILPAGRFATPLDAAPTVRSNNYGVHAELTWETSAGSLIFIPAWRRNGSLDYSTQLAAGILVDNTNSQKSAELRFVGNQIGMFDYQVGAYYLDEKSSFHFAVNQATLFNQQDFTQGTESYAAFARITAHLGDNFRLVGAGRYTKDKKFYDSVGSTLVIACTTLPTPCSTVPLFPSVSSIDLLPSVFNVPPATGGVSPIFLNGVPTGAILNRGPAAIYDDDTYSASKFTYRAAVEFDVGPRSLLYASIETGFRSGGQQQNVGFETYRPENITAYTIGTKNRFLNNRLQLNVEAFYWEYVDQQLASITLDASGRQGNFVKNIGNSTNYGVDFEAVYSPSPDTRLGAKVQYLNATYDDFKYTAPANPAPLTPCPVSVAGTVATIDCSGNPAYNAPKWTMNLAAEQTINLDEYKFIVSADTQYKSSRWVGFDYLEGMMQKASWTSNAQIEFSPQDDKWSIAAYVRNIENNRLTANAIYLSVLRAVLRSPSAPRTFGVRASMRF